MAMLYLAGIILGFFLSFVLFTKRNKSHADYILSAWIAVTSLNLLAYYLFITDQYDNFLSFMVIGFSLPLAQGPFLYLYTRQQTSSEAFDKKQLLHFLPLLISLLLFTKFHLLPSEQKMEIFRQKGQGYELQNMINLYAIYLSGIVYVALSLSRLLKYRRNMVNLFSNTEKINFNWLLYLIIWMMIIWATVLIVRDDKLIYGAVALFILWLGYFGIKQVQVFSHQPPAMHIETSASGDSAVIQNSLVEPTDTDRAPEENVFTLKYQKSTLTEQDAEEIHQRLQQLMREQKLYKNPDLTLNDLAGHLKVHPNHLSQVINSKEKKNFYDMINERRVEEFIERVSQPVSQQFTFLAIAYDCGFNSKASFNRNFKKYTGLTPSDYQKQKLVA